MKIIRGALFIGMASLGSMAMAQAQAPESASPPQSDSPSMEGPSAAPAPTEQTPSDMGAEQSTGQAAPAATPVSDSEVQKFATAIVALNKVQDDAAVPAEQKQKAMVAKVKATGLSAERFNEIAAASKSDPQLASRIQAAVTKAKAAS